jgi:hypothetical protein
LLPVAPITRFFSIEPSVRGKSVSATVSETHIKLVKTVSLSLSPPCRWLHGWPSLFFLLSHSSAPWTTADGINLSIDSLIYDCLFWTLIRCSLTLTFTLSLHSIWWLFETWFKMK